MRYMGTSRASCTSSGSRYSDCVCISIAINPVSRARAIRRAAFIHENFGCCLLRVCIVSCHQVTGSQRLYLVVRPGSGTIGELLFTQRGFENSEAWIWTAVPFMIGAVIVLDIAIILCLALLDCALRTLRHSPLPRRRHLLR